MFYKCIGKLGKEGNITIYEWLSTLVFTLYACKHVRKCVCIDVCKCASVYACVCIHVYMHVYMHVYVPFRVVCMCCQVRGSCVFVCRNVCSCVYMFSILLT